ncbi:MAG: diguanylate cyclase [Lachnospiraceae bacterium]
MKNINSLTCNESIVFIKHFFRVYLEEQNVQLLQPLLYEDIIWFDSITNQVCKGFYEVHKLLESQYASWMVPFTITQEWYQTSSISTELCVVYGQLELTCDSSHNNDKKTNYEFSLIYHTNEPMIIFYSAHFYIPNNNPFKNETSPTMSLHKDTLFLEKKLKEQTQLLQEKNMELETLTNNIYGGILVCNYDATFSILFANEGYHKLTGYTFEETKELIETMHISIIYPEDIASLHANVSAQLDVGNNYEVEYRIVRKDGAIIWVLEKGILLPTQNEAQKIQCILTDITKQKQVEETLRISEQRYKIAIGFSDVAIFEYNVVTGGMILPESDASLYNLPTLLPEGYETLINVGVVNPESQHDFRKLFQEIKAGAPHAQSHIHTTDTYGQLHEYELNLTNIFDDNGHPIHAVGARKNVTQLCQLQKETAYGNIMIGKQQLAYEANISQDIIISYNESWMKHLNISNITSFSALAKYLCEYVIAPEYQEQMSQILSIDYILSAYNRGERLISLEYKRKFGSDFYHWFRKSLHIIKDRNTGDVNIRCYILDIDDMKKHELETLYNAEHDLLTGFYNKTATEQQITKFLNTEEGMKNNHAFFIIDADHFKHINDNFGHAFGDIILSKMAEKIAALFCNVDVLGRIGGDEFIVFMKNIKNDKDALSKAQEICDTLSDHLENCNDQCMISVSIGIAFYNRHGDTYNKLYNNSDIALYASKERGRNQCTVYNEEMPPLQNGRKQLDLKKLLDNKSFEEHVTEYLF